MRVGKITSKQSGAYALLSGGRCAGTHSGRAAFYRCVVLVGFVLVPVAVSRGSPGPASSSLRGPFPQALILLGGVGFIAWRLRQHFILGMPTGPEAFVGIPGLSGLRPSAWTHLKSLVPYSSGWWDGRQIPIISKLPNYR